MARCAHKGGRCSCSPPTDITVKGHYRELTGRRKRRKPPAAPKGPYYVAESSTGERCRHHHRTRSGARRCSNAMNREARARHARLPKRAAKATRVTRWDVERVTA